MGLNFTKHTPLKSYQHVVEQIQTAICDGELRQGERLPPEMKLKEMFDTSRGTVREALRVLEQKGLISVRTGVKGGAVVQEANTDAMNDSMALLIRHRKISLPHLAEFRELLEGHAAAQAAQSATPDDLSVLDDILTEIQAHIDGNPDSWDLFHELDARFHQALARIAGNPLLQANLDTIHKNIHTYFSQYLPFSRDLLLSDFQDLCGIMEAVSQGDAKAARERAQAHVARFSSMMAEGRPGGTLRP